MNIHQILRAFSVNINQDQLSLKAKENALVFLGFYVLATSTITSGWVPTCESVHSLNLYNAAPLGDQTARTMPRFPTQSHYLDAELTSPFPILVMLNVRLGKNKY